jgi:hypothetical protein
LHILKINAAHTRFCGKHLNAREQIEFMLTGAFVQTFMRG